MDKEKKPSRTPNRFKELEKIVKFCTKSGVAEVKMGDIHVIFGDVQPAPRKPRKAVIREQARSEEQTLLQEQADAVQEEIEVSHIEDPVAYEEAIAKGLLTDGAGQQETDNHRAQ